MPTNKMPKLAFQHHSLLGEDHWHSGVISLLRGMAAIQVAAAHLRGATFPGVRSVEEPSIWFLGLAFATGFAHQAVLVFFVISGWLVGGSLLNKVGQPGAIAGYAIDRVTRLWTVLVPTFLLTLLCGLGTGVVSPEGIDYSAVNEYSALTFAGNLVGLQHVVLPEFGANFPLWSLANETWYYVLFPLLVLLFTSRRAVARLACGAALAVLAISLPYALVLYFAVWLLGVAFSRIRIDCGIATRLGLLLLLGAVSVFFRLTGENDDFVVGTFWQDLACSLAFVVCLSSLQFKAAPGSKLLRPVAGVGKFFAEFSFSLYVLHVPLIGLLVHLGTTRFGLRQLSPGAPQHLAIYFGMLAIVLMASYLSYRLFEAQTYRLRKMLKRLLLEDAASAAAASALRAD